MNKVIFTKQGVRDLDKMYPIKRTEKQDIPATIKNCAHDRMRMAYCNGGACKKPCLLKCHCGFTWMINEGVYG